MSQEPELRWALPDSWVWTSLSELGDIVAGGTPSTKEPSYWADEIHWISPADLTGYSAKTIKRGAKSISMIGLANSSAKVMPAGSVHFSSRAPIGYVVISAESLATNQGFKSLIPASGIFNEYVYYYLLASREYARKRASGTTFSELSGKAFGRLPIPLAPTATQHRIVAKIEELFSELDKGVENLKTARAQLKVYRQALLKHAFEGKFTAKWRVENKDKLEKPEQLLTRIKQEREAQYERQLKKWKAAVKTWDERGKPDKRPLKPRRQDNSLPPTAEELEKMPALPAAWQWVKLGQLLWSVKDGPHYSPKYSNSGIPFITGGNIHSAGIDFSSAKFITPELHKELSQRCKPERGDVLYTKGGTTGIARVNTSRLDFNVWVHVAVLKATRSVEPFYLQHALNSPGCYAQSQKYTHGVGNQDLGLTRMVNIVLPLCCIAEQKRIIQIAERVTSELDKIEDDIGRALMEAKAIRQSILKKAFTGQLVPQDPNDEPASALLERIKAERAVHSDKTITPGRRRHAKATA